MSDKNVSDTRKNWVRERVDRSGFPFQMAVEEIVRSGKHGWNIVGSELPWRDKSGADCYIDLVLDYGSSLAVIECKRVKEAKPGGAGAWLFFANPDIEQNRDVRLFRIDAKQQGPNPYYDDLTIRPTSFETTFAATADKDESAVTIAGKLVTASETVAWDIAEKLNGDFMLITYPVIVTNAELWLCRFEPGEIDLASGTLTDGANFDGERQPWMRLRVPLNSEFEVRYKSKSIIGGVASDGSVPNPVEKESGVTSC